MDGARVAGSREELEEVQRSFDEGFRHDSGAALSDWFADDAQLLWPEEGAIVGPEAIGQADHVVERVHGRVAYAWRFEAGRWRCTRLMTSRYAPNEVVG